MAEEDFNEDYDPLEMRRGEGRLPERPTPFDKSGRRANKRKGITARPNEISNPYGLSGPGVSGTLPASKLSLSPEIAEIRYRVNQQQVEAAAARVKYEQDRAAAREKAISADISEGAGPAISEDAADLETPTKEAQPKQSTSAREGRGEEVDFDASGYSPDAGGTAAYAQRAGAGFSSSGLGPESLIFGGAPTSATPAGREFAERRSASSPGIRLSFAPGVLERTFGDDGSDIEDPAMRPVPLSQGRVRRKSAKDTAEAKKKAESEAKKLERYKAAVEADKAAGGGDAAVSKLPEEVMDSAAVRDFRFPSSRAPMPVQRDDVSPTMYNPPPSPPPPVGTVIPGTRKGEVIRYSNRFDGEPDTFTEIPTEYGSAPYTIKPSDHVAYRNAVEQHRAGVAEFDAFNQRMRARMGRTLASSPDTPGISLSDIQGPDSSEFEETMRSRGQARRDEDILAIRSAARPSGRTATARDRGVLPGGVPTPETPSGIDLEQLNRGGFAKRFSDILEDSPQVERRNPSRAVDAGGPPLEVRLGVMRDYLGPRKPTDTEGDLGEPTGVTHDTQFSTVPSGESPLITGELGFVIPRSGGIAEPGGVARAGLARAGSTRDTLGEPATVEAFKFTKTGEHYLDDETGLPMTTSVRRPALGREITKEGADKLAAGLPVPRGAEGVIRASHRTTMAGLRQSEDALRDVAERTTDPSWAEDLETQAEAAKTRRSQIPDLGRTTNLVEEAESQRSELTGMMEDYPGKMTLGGDNPLGGQARRITFTRGGGIRTPGPDAIARILDPNTGRLRGGAGNASGVPTRTSPASVSTYLQAAQEAGLIASGEELTEAEAEARVNRAASAVRSGRRGAAGVSSASALESTRAINERNISETGEIVDPRNPPVRESAMGEDPVTASPARRTTFRRGNSR